MANNPFFSDTCAKAGVDAQTALCNSGKLRVYDGSQPTDANTAVGSQNLLGEFTFGATAFAAAACSGSAPNRVAVATANAIADTECLYTSTATWFRAVKSDGTTVVFDGTVGLSGCDLNLTDVTLTDGETMSVSSLTFTQPE